MAVPRLLSWPLEFHMRSQPTLDSSGTECGGQVRINLRSVVHRPHPSASGSCLRVLDIPNRALSKLPGDITPVTGPSFFCPWLQPVRPDVRELVLGAQDHQTALPLLVRGLPGLCDFAG